MNMFRNILTVASIAFAIALWYVKIDDWKWVNYFGEGTIQYIEFLISAQPFSTIVFAVIGIALFMTRKQY
jgi:hypothetical protein